MTYRSLMIGAAAAVLLLAACGESPQPQAPAQTPAAPADTPAAPATEAPAEAPAGARSLTVVSWGGDFTRSQVEAYHKPFMAQNEGVTIVSVDYNGEIGPVRAQVESGNVTWDVVDFELADAMRACDEGLLEPIDPAMLAPAPDGTAAVDDFVQYAITECAVATIVFSHQIAYSTTAFAETPPDGPEDFFDLGNFPGKRGLRKQSPKVNLELALLADGVPAGEIYAVLSTPEGLDRAFAKLDTIKSEVVWWEAGAQPPQLLADGEVVMSMGYNGRFFRPVVVEKKPIAVIWNGQLTDVDVLTVVRGAPNKDLAMEFVRFATATEQLAEQARWINYAPARNSALPLVSTHAELGVEMMPFMPTAPANYANHVALDHRWWADRQDDITERWTAWLAQ